MNLTEKEEIRLEGKVSEANPKATVTWHKDNVEIKASKRVLIAKPVVEALTNASVHSLCISESGPADVGLYTLRAANKLATVESQCTIEVLSAPKVTKDMKPKMEVTAGEKVTLDVTATGMK